MRSHIVTELTLQKSLLLRAQGQWYESRIKRLLANPHISLLITKCELLGLLVRFNYEHSPWWFGTISGAIITINMRQPSGQFWNMDDITFLLAHEFRHAEHRELGLFKQYYSSRDEYRPDLFKIGLAAERDCDAYAKKYVNQANPKNKSILKHRLYPGWRVCPFVLPEKILTERLKIEFFFRNKYPHPILKKTNPYNQITNAKQLRSKGLL